VSFRLRVLLLIFFLVATSTAATAWLTLRQASQQLTASAAASERDVALAVDELGDYGQVHGTWFGIDALVRSLADRLHQRIRVVTEAGTVLADSDLLAGRGHIAGHIAIVEGRSHGRLDGGVRAGHERQYRAVVRRVGLHVE